MGKDYRALFQYGYRRSGDQDAPAPVRHKVVVVGAGPIGLAAAIDLAQRGIPVVLLDDNDKIGEGSRAICFSKRALEVCDTLGVGDRMVEKGVRWQVGKVFLDNELVHRFDLLPEPGYKRPAFINLQQYYIEAFMVDRVAELPLVDLRWRNKVAGLERGSDHVKVAIDTPDGPYAIQADWLIAADGARSALRDYLGLGFEGQVFNDRFLIVDIEMEADFPPERWFHFEPPFHKGQSVLLHKQPDNIWRIDFQLGPEADDVEERKPERVIPRLKAMLGED
ncbi:MAG: FAD-dependent oxidoreductase, partial [Hyphomicrobiaceae bacterium]